MRYSLEVTKWIIRFFIFSHLLLSLPRKGFDKHNLHFGKAATKQGFGEGVLAWTPSQSSHAIQVPPPRFQRCK